MSPKVSIIIPTYNRVKYLREALESALAQTYRAIEIIVVNDGSTDGTEQFLARYLKFIRYIEQKNGGCAAAKNTGLAAATGAFITNLDDDDRMHPERTQRQVEMFEAHPELGICGTGVRFIDAQGKLIERYMPPRFSRKTQVLQLLRRCILVQSSVMIRREVHQRLGGYKNMLSEDYEFWLRAALHYDIGAVEAYLTDYRLHGDQITGPKTRPELDAAVRRLIQKFIADTPLERVIPGLRATVYGQVLVGLLLCEQKLYHLSEVHFRNALPHPVGDLGLGLLELYRGNLSGTEPHFRRVKAFDSVFSPKVDEALRLVKRIRTLRQNCDAKLNPMAAEVVALREDLSRFNTTVIRLLLRLATVVL
jgi:glycosyltransferase involved in cell wall biosynthesis